MKKFAFSTLTVALMLTLLVGCGKKDPVEVPTTQAPTTEAMTQPVETDAVTESTDAAETTDGTTDATEAVEATELEKLMDSLYAAHGEIDLPLMSNVLDLNDADAVKYNTGLATGDKLSEVVVSEPMMGQAYSLVLAKVKDAADAEAVAKEMFENIDTRKWVCVEADTKTAAFSGDTVMFFMVSSDFADLVSTESVMEAFKTVAGGEVTEIG